MRKIVIPLVIGATALLGFSATVQGARSEKKGAATLACVLLPDTKSSVRWETQDRRFLAASFKKAGVTYSIVNAENDAHVSVLVLSDDWNGPWVQVDGDAEVLHMPEAADALVDYFRCISGEHPDWDEYRQAMRLQDKSLIRITPTRWGPIATGGFPADVAARLDS